MDSVHTRFVTGGGSRSDLIRAASDDHRLAAQFGAFQEFHGNEEGVHVHVKDGGRREQHLLFRLAVLGAEACEVRHSLSLRRWIVADNHAERALANRVLRKSRTPKKAWLQSLRGDDAGDSGEVVVEA